MVASRRVYIRFALATTLGLCAACDQADYGEQLLKDRVKDDLGVSWLETPVDAVVRLPPSTQLWSGEEWGAPRVAALWEDKVLVSDFKGSPYFHLIDLQTGTRVWSRGRRGEGPGEFTSVAGFLVPPGDGRGVYVYDYNQRRLTHYAGTSDTLRHTRDSVVPVLSRHLELVALRNGGVLASAHDSLGTAFTLLNEQFKAVGSFGSRVDSLEGVPSSEYRGAYQASMCVSPDGSMAALAYTSSGRVDLYDIEERQLSARAQVPFYFPPNLDVHPLTRALKFNGPSPNRRTAYISCAATENAVFALFSGKLKRDYPYPRSSETPEIHVFAWDGRLLGVYHLDHEAYLILIPETADRIISITYGERPTLRSTQLDAMRMTAGARIRQ